MPDWVILAVGLAIGAALCAWDRTAARSRRRVVPDPLQLPGFLPGEREEWRRRG